MYNLIFGSLQKLLSKKTNLYFVEVHTFYKIIFICFFDQHVCRLDGCTNNKHQVHIQLHRVDRISNARNLVFKNKIPQTCYSVNTMYEVKLLFYDLKDFSVHEYVARYTVLDISARAYNLSS